MVAKGETFEKINTLILSVKTVFVKINSLCITEFHNRLNYKYTLLSGTSNTCLYRSLRFVLMYKLEFFV